MQEEILYEIKKNFEEEKKGLDFINKNADKIRSLAQSPDVVDYFSLVHPESNPLDVLNNLPINEEQIIMSEFAKIKKRIKPPHTNRIYLYMGAFSKVRKRGRNSKEHIILAPKHAADYCVYQNLELDYPERIPIKCCDQFEQENNIIYPDSNSFKYQDQYNNIQKEFIIKMVKSSQDDAVKYILKQHENNN